MFPRKNEGGIITIPSFFWNKTLLPNYNYNITRVQLFLNSRQIFQLKNPHLSQRFFRT